MTGRRLNLSTCNWGTCEAEPMRLLLLCEMHARKVHHHIAWVDEQQKVHVPTQRPRAKAHERTGWVYYLNVGGVLKIGFEKYLGSRLSAYPPGTEVLGNKRGTMADEQAEHQRCTPWRVAGREWYELNESTMKVVEEAKCYEAARLAAEQASRPVPPRPQPVRRVRPPSPPPAPSPRYAAEFESHILTRRNGFG